MSNHWHITIVGDPQDPSTRVDMSIGDARMLINDYEQQTLEMITQWEMLGKREGEDDTLLGLRRMLGMHLGMRLEYLAGLRGMELTCTSNNWPKILENWRKRWD